jgi:hypothetical protein
LVHDGGMTHTEQTQMIVFAAGMLVACGLMIMAAVSGVHDVPFPDRSRAQTLTVLAPVIVISVCLAIFPWSAIF